MKIFLTALTLALCFNSASKADTRYDKIKGMLLSIAGKYPQNAKLIKIGDSDSGDAILGLQVGNGPTHNLVVATHHGNEYGSTYVGMAFAESMAAEPLPDQTVFIIPVLNISGYNTNERREIARGTTWDPNRNYPGPCGTEGPFTLKSTSALAQFIDQNNIIASATLHTFASLVLYPWGISTHQTSTPYDSLFMELGKASAVESGYAVGNSTELLYPADGCYEDYAFWKHGIWSLLFEIGNTHSPSNQNMTAWAKSNVPGLRRMMKMAPKVRVLDHAFHGKCDARMHFLDRHNE